MRCLQISYRWQAPDRKLLTDLLTSKPEALRDSQRHRQFGQSIEKLPKLNVAGSNPVTRLMDN
jgi:hypothetical protein